MFARGMGGTRDKDADARGWSVIFQVDPRERALMEEELDRPTGRVEDADADTTQTGVVSRDQTVIDRALIERLVAEDDEAPARSPNDTLRDDQPSPFTRLRLDDPAGQGDRDRTEIVRVVVPKEETELEPDDDPRRTLPAGRDPLLVEPPRPGWEARERLDLEDTDLDHPRARRGASSTDSPEAGGPIVRRSVVPVDPANTQRGVIKRSDVPLLTPEAMRGVKPIELPRTAPLEDELLDAPPIPAHMLKELGPPQKMRDAEVTVLDLAAQIGLAPEPTAKAEADKNDGRAVVLPKPAGGAEAAPDRAVALPLPLEGDAARAVEMLEEQAKVQAARGSGPNPLKNEDLAEHLPRWLVVTDTAARTIPWLIAVFVVVASLVIMVMLVSGVGTGATEHVTLRFLALDARAQAAGSTPTMLTIETEPPGVLVVLDQKILGPTPLTIESPSPEKLGIELTSPYYETWVGQATKSDDGSELRASAKLTKRRRR